MRTLNDSISEQPRLEYWQVTGRSLHFSSWDCFILSWNTSKQPRELRNMERGQKYLLSKYFDYKSEVTWSMLGLHLHENETAVLAILSIAVDKFTILI